MNPQHQPQSCSLLCPANITAISLKVDMRLSTFPVTDSQAFWMTMHIQCRAILQQSTLHLQGICMLRESVRALMSQLRPLQIQ